MIRRLSRDEPHERSRRQTQTHFPQKKGATAPLDEAVGRRATKRPPAAGVLPRSFPLCRPELLQTPSGSRASGRDGRPPEEGRRAFSQRRGRSRRRESRRPQRLLGKDPQDRARIHAAGCSPRSARAFNPIAAADGLKGLTQAPEAAFPQRLRQTCIARPLRSSAAFVHLYFLQEGSRRRLQSLEEPPGTARTAGSGRLRTGGRLSESSPFSLTTASSPLLISPSPTDSPAKFSLS